METNAWAYLNITHPVCAWATYRGVLVPPPKEPGFLSVWTSGRLRQGDFPWLGIEFELEKARRERHPDCTSRLTGLYCFANVESAHRATTWGRSFDPSYLNELHVEGGFRDLQPMDANWISFAREHGDVSQWADRYWSGEPCPDFEPIWEMTVQSRAWVLDTALRERAYQIIKRYMPSCLVLLETARLAAWLGSDLGNVACFLTDDGEHLVGRHFIDMREAGDPMFLRKISELVASGHPVNREDTNPLVAKFGTFVTPDLTMLDFKIKKADHLQSI